MTNQRITREGMLMEVAQLVAKRGTCSRLQVGAVFAKDGRIVATGYNGAPRWVPHCRHDDVVFEGWGIEDEFYPVWLPENLEIPIGARVYFDGSQVTIGDGACSVAQHAEANAIGFAAREGIALGGTTLYCTHAPCLGCSRLLINAGVEKVVYREPYRLTEGIDLLKAVGIKIFDISQLKR